MAAISLAIIGKNNEPLFIKEFFDESNRCSTNFLYEEELFGLPPPKDRPPPACSLRQQFILHSALDRFEQLAGPSPGYAWRTTNASGTDAMFVGLLCPVDDLRVYGYMTTTQIKFILCVEDDALPDDQPSVDEMIKRLLFKIHRLYVEQTLNPFSSMGAPISSPRFESQLKSTVTAYNHAVAR
jgi:hypothetical protein